MWRITENVRVSFTTMSMTAAVAAITKVMEETGNLPTADIYEMTSTSHEDNRNSFIIGNIICRSFFFVNDLTFAFLAHLNLFFQLFLLRVSESHLLILPQCGFSVPGPPQTPSHYHSITLSVLDSCFLLFALFHFGSKQGDISVSVCRYSVISQFIRFRRPELAQDPWNWRHIWQTGSWKRFETPMTLDLFR